MCGIAGFWGQGNEQTLANMVEQLHHRGPDANGTYLSTDSALDDSIYFGHARLAIVDIKDGQQPFVDKETGVALVYNGELYDHLELREELIRRGHRFVTGHSDTETVLRAFIEWGPECFAKFNGMFALGIHDPRTHSIWLARDRFGEKPLFYCHSGSSFGFASEIAALAQWDGFTATTDFGNLQRFFAWGYMPGNRTLYTSCHSLLPGTYMHIDVRTAHRRENRYYSFTLTPDHSLQDKDEPQLVEELRSLLVQSVKRRLMSDVPLGIFLSGGVDSSAILAAASKSVPAENIKAFSIGFTEPSFDESPNAKAVAAAYGVQHYLEMLTIDDMRAGALKVLSRMSEPLGDASLIPTHALSAFTRKHVTVALSGDGGDELFAGYDPFMALTPARIYECLIPKTLHRGIKSVVHRFKSSDKNMSLEFKLKRTLRGLDYSSSMRLPVWMSPLTPQEISDFFECPLSAEELYEDALVLWEQNKHFSPAEQALMFFTHFYLPNDILVKVDRATMMESLESRAVFLDNDMANFCARLPLRFKLRGNTRKYLLKKALHGWLPHDILQLPKKGFGIPLNRWLRELEPPYRNIPGMRSGTLEQASSVHNRREGDYRLFLWSALALQSINGVKSA